jgi:class 3 adenylate cyclase
MRNLQDWLRGGVRRRYVFGVATALIAALFANFIVDRTAVEAAERASRDLRMAMTPRQTPINPEFALVLIDQHALATYPYLNPINRAYLADLMIALDAHGAKRIGLDIVLDRPTTARDDERLRETLHGLKTPLIIAAPKNASTLFDAAFFRRMTQGIETARAVLIEDTPDRVIRTQRAFASDTGEATFAAKLAGVRAPSNATLAIPYSLSTHAYKPWPFATYDAATLLTMPAEDSMLKGKTVLVGADLPDIDRKRTPLQASTDLPDFPGVVVHAYQAAQLHDKSRLASLGAAWGGVITLLAALTGVFGLYFSRTAMRSLAVLVLGPALIVMAAFALHSGSGVMMPFSAPIIAFVFAAVGGATLASRTNQAQSRRIDRAFRHYMDPKIVDTLVRQPQLVPVAPIEREIAILMCDVQGFTTMAENAETKKLGQMLSQFYDLIIHTIVSHHGVIDKLTGDGAMTLFNAPAKDANYKENAVRCALALDAACEEFRRKPQAAALGWGPTRIAVHAGPALMGSFGGRNRLHFTVLGHTVNLTSRLEQANKVLGTRVLVSSSALCAATDTLFRPAARLVLRGAVAPVQAYTPMAEGLDATHYLAAYSAMARGDDEARALFEAAIVAGPDDLLARAHAQRLARAPVTDTIVLSALHP